MRHSSIAGLIALCAATTAVSGAEIGAPLNGAEFEAAVTGRTLYFNSDGQPYGVEQYLPGRKVVWAFVGDDCRKGDWYEDNGRICFVYEDNPDPQCWLFSAIPGGLAARSMNYPDSAPLIALEQSPEPIACLGPNVGV